MKKLILLLLFAAGTSSVTFAQSEWAEYKADKGNFAVLMPGTPIYEQQEYPSAAGNMLMHMYQLDAEDEGALVLNYSVLYTELPAGFNSDSPKEGLDAYFDASAKGTASVVRGKVVSMTDESFQNFPGKAIQIEFEGDNGVVYVITQRSYIIKDKAYLLQTLSEKPNTGNADEQKFLKSFKLVG